MDGMLGMCNCGPQPSVAPPRIDDPTVMAECDMRGRRGSLGTSTYYSKLRRTWSGSDFRNYLYPNTLVISSHLFPRKLNRRSRSLDLNICRHPSRQFMWLILLCVVFLHTRLFSSNNDRRL
jgi:hypothetical protein